MPGFVGQSARLGAVHRDRRPAGLRPTGLRPTGLRLAGLRLAGLRPAGLRPAGLRPAGATLAEGGGWSAPWAVLLVPVAVHTASLRAAATAVPLLHRTPRPSEPRYA